MTIKQAIAAIILATTAKPQAYVPVDQHGTGWATIEANGFMIDVYRGNCEPVDVLEIIRDIRNN